MQFKQMSHSFFCFGTFACCERSRNYKTHYLVCYYILAVQATHNSQITILSVKCSPKSLLVSHHARYYCESIYVRTTAPSVEKVLAILYLYLSPWRLDFSPCEHEHTFSIFYSHHRHSLASRMQPKYYNLRVVELQVYAEQGKFSITVDICMLLRGR